jgi:hypothetical protein
MKMNHFTSGEQSPCEENWTARDEFNAHDLARILYGFEYQLDPAKLQYARSVVCGCNIVANHTLRFGSF